MKQNKKQQTSSWKILIVVLLIVVFGIIIYDKLQPKFEIITKECHNETDYDIMDSCLDGFNEMFSITWVNFYNEIDTSLENEIWGTRNKYCSERSIKQVCENESINNIQYQLKDKDCISYSIGQLYGACDLYFYNPNPGYLSQQYNICIEKANKDVEEICIDIKNISKKDITEEFFIENNCGCKKSINEKDKMIVIDNEEGRSIEMIGEDWNCIEWKCFNDYIVKRLR